MLRTLWSAISFIAVVHLLTLLLFTGWLWQSGRLNPQRVEEIRRTLSMTIEEANEAEEAAETEAQEAVEEELDQARQKDPLPQSGRRLSYVARIEQRARDRARRTEAELADLEARLAAARAALASERDAFEEEKAEWEAERKMLAERQEDAQFQRVVRLLETIPAKQAKENLIALIEGGNTGDAVHYLDAMKQYNAAKVLREFKTDEEQQLATELLQRLKTLGAAGPVDGKTPNADSAAESG